MLCLIYKLYCIFNKKNPAVAYNFNIAAVYFTGLVLQILSVDNHLLDSRRLAEVKKHYFLVKISATDSCNTSV